MLGLDLGLALGLGLAFGLGFEPSSPMFVNLFSVLRGCPSRWYDLGTTLIKPLIIKPHHV